MEEFFFRAVERVGFPIAVSVLSFWAVYKLFSLREKDRSGQLGLLVDEARKQTSSLSSIDGRVSASHDMTLQMINKLGNDPGKLCQAAELIDLATKATEAKEKAEAALRHDAANAENQKALRAEVEKLKAKLNPGGV